MSTKTTGIIDVAVMPKVGRAACWFALSLSLALARRGFNYRSNRHSIELFKDGDLVSVLPTREVYKFKGIYKEYNLIKLELLADRGKGTTSIPLSELSRLQRTEKNIPRGKGNLSSNTVEPSPLDLIIETSSFGNAEFFDTEVIYLGKKVQFQNSMSTVNVGRKVNEKYLSFNTAEIFPWGRVTTDGNVRPEGDATGMARPLVARANSAIDILEFLKKRDTDCRMIIVDDIRVLESELNLLCRLMDDYGCKVVSFCGFKDFKELQKLQHTGRIEAKQINPASIARPDENGIFGKIAASANRAIDFEWIETFQLTDEVVDQCAISIEASAKLLQDSDTDIEYNKLIGKGFSLLRRLTNTKLNGDVDLEAADLIAELKSNYENIKGFWPSEARKSFNSFLDELDTIQLSSKRLAKIKRNAVEALIARTLSDEELNFDDVHFIEAGDETLVLSGWPRRAKVQEWVFEYDHDCVIAVAFDFEARWFRQFNKAYRDAELFAADPNLPYRPTSGDIEARQHWRTSKIDELNNPEIDRNAIRDRLMFRNELKKDSLLRGQIVWFTDGRICVSSERHKLPTLRSLGAFLGETNTNISFSNSMELEPGDLCVFRSDSGGDLVRSLARQTMGAELYDKTRSVAESWRYALHDYTEKENLTVSELQKRLANKDINRTQTSLRNWLYGPTIIGPQLKEDLVRLLLAMDSPDSHRTVDEVWTSIQEIRRSHRTAGTDVSDLLREELVNELTSRETLTGHYTLSLGEVDVVEVEALDPENIETNSSYMNRLLKPERLGA